MRTSFYAIVFGAAAIALLSARSAHAQVMYTNKVVGSNGRPQCLAVKDGRIANSSPLIIWDCINGDPSQTFTFQGDGTMRVGAPGSQYCVAAYDGVQRGTRIGVWQCQPGHPTQKLSLGMYLDLFFVNSNPTLCLGVQNASKNPGSPIIGWDCSKTGNDNQAWSAARTSAPPAPVAAVRPTTLPAVPNAGLAPTAPGFISHNGSALVAAGAGNVVAAGAGNVVAAGAGNVVAAGAGNVVAAGAGNVVAAGAGNLQAAGNHPSEMMARQYSVQSVGTPNINQILQSAQGGDVNAQYQAATYYAQHNDMVNGYAWAAIAAAHGNGSAASSRDGWANSMTKQQIQQAVLVIASHTK